MKNSLVDYLLKMNSIFCQNFIFSLLVLSVCNYQCAFALNFDVSGTITSAYSTIGSIATSFVGLFIDTECDDTWNKPNMTALREVLVNKLHGQHLVIDSVIRSIHGHLKFPEPSKALVLSFHGMTGSGKNFVSRLIAEALYPSGMRSSKVHLIHAPTSFPHQHLLPAYQDDLRAWIRGNVSQCSRNLFIFDEMDKMPAGLINTIKPFIDHYPQIEGIDYRKNIFLFLSNTGGREIMEYTLQHWTNGLDRSDIKYHKLEDILLKTAFNEEGGLWHCNLIDHNLISAFIPFLPLERGHVMKCIEDDLSMKHLPIQAKFVNKIADEMHYFPEDIRLYSSTGCKRVSEKVNFYWEFHDEL